MILKTPTLGQIQRYGNPALTALSRWQSNYPPSNSNPYPSPICESELDQIIALFPISANDQNYTATCLRSDTFAKLLLRCGYDSEDADADGNADADGDADVDRDLNRCSKILLYVIITE